MRLWHIDLIPYLPNGQLLAQWRELNSIFKKQDNHILINYVYKYDKSYLLNYTKHVMQEFKNRGYYINAMLNYTVYFGDTTCDGTERFDEHDFDYLTICYYNLKEKFLRGQGDFTQEVWNELVAFYHNEERLQNTTFETY